jgi:uncharacterized protein (TIGR03437 family)
VGRLIDRIDRRRSRAGGVLGQIAIVLAICVTGVDAQLVTKLDAIPKTGKPPVVFVHGYQNDCSTSSFSGTFGIADQLMQRDGRVSVFFDNCVVPGHPPIEDLGNELRSFLARLRYEGGEDVPLVDIVAHSMGGLIVRSYLSGKQAQEGVFTPPAETRVRKIVFLATPHFGSPATTLLAGFGGGNRQTDQLQVASAFVFDLATWNQGIEDLRGADAVAVIGNPANGALLMRRDFGDGVTTLTSGSLSFAMPGRTRVVPYCHTSIASILCTGSRGNIAELNSADHLTARILVSFLGDTQDWRSIGDAPEQNSFLSANGGLLLRYKDTMDRLLTLRSATAPGIGELLRRGETIFGELLPASPGLQLTLDLSGSTVAVSVPLTAGITHALTFKPGPSISAVFPSASAVYPRAAAPGSLISIYGSQLTATGGDPEVFVAGKRMPLSFSGPNQINTSIPENVSGLVKIQVKNTSGEHSVNVLIEPNVPSIFAPALNAVTATLVTAQSPLRPGDYVALFVTGLGRTTLRDDGLNWADVRPEVTLGGQPCTVTFAGRAPGFPGLDQINCQLASNLQVSDAAQVTVRSGARVSNVTTLPVR